ncbi:IDEAL domain-containing protein [Kurthia gibsonii]|uniref:IDEAL domain-containing protein n=1 Tax=Kurthia gibsonii TaxID=33946 RepID=UPI002DB96952|nr:IDEAL domain-containing protein [Kurthia gibsonii]MEB6111980.1 IDEAL domain-containing protein [Kurthia gibsonii]
MEYRYSQQNSPNNEQPLSQGLQGQDLLNDLYMDMFLQHLLADQQIRLLREAIDVALDERDEEAFKRFTKELIQLQDTLIDEE